ncbi:MAG: DUF4065 domain-containing protein [Dinoroseobacter sp.]|nr:DUF4065 domain-containing protein [Dinoroseobacter sp.]
MYDPRVIANHVLEEAWNRDIDLTQVDIQKIVYFLNGHHLVEHGTPMVEGEFEAWEYGPVQRILLDSFRRFEDGPITEFAVAFDPIRRKRKTLPSISSNSVSETIDRFLDDYLEMGAFDMVDITHDENTPWSVTMQEAKHSANIGMRISSELIRERFERKAVY